MSIPKFSLGWELEAVRKASYVPTGVSVGSDGSVNGDGVEYKVNKKLVNNIEANLKALRALCENEAIRVDSTCGFHVHIGVPGRNKRAHIWAGWFITLGRLIESEAMRAVPDSRKRSQHCKLLSSDERINVSILNKEYEQNKYSNGDRYFWVNVVEMFRPRGLRTVEIRLLGETHRYDYCLAWIAACFLMARHAWALIDDPSMLAAVTQELRQAFRRIAAYIKPNTAHATKESKRLAMQSGLITRETGLKEKLEPETINSEPAIPAEAIERYT